MFHDTRGGKHEKYFRVFSCVIYTIIVNYVCVDYLACQSKQLCEITMGSKHGERVQNNIGYCNYIFIIELIVVSWFFEERKFCCHIKTPQNNVGILFFKRI